MNDMMKDPMVLRQIIMDHDKYPRNRKLIDDKRYLRKHMASDSCIDDIEVQARIENGLIKDIRFDGVACTISTASTSIMSELLSDKTISEAKEIIKNYRDMINELPYDGDLLEEAVAFQNVGKQANRIHCATIGWDAIEQIMKESEK